jgi:hypothetical protein|eukprot:5708486-Prymnesium_polylepis.1
MFVYVDGVCSSIFRVSVYVDELMLLFECCVLLMVPRHVAFAKAAMANRVAPPDLKVVEDLWFSDHAQPLDCTTTESSMDWRELLAMHAASTTPDQSVVKAALSKGVPHEMRPEVWLTFSGAAARMAKHPHVYAQLCSRIATAAELRAQDAAAAAEAAAASSSSGSSSSVSPPRNPMLGVVEQVEKDLRRTEAGTEGEKLNALRRVLCAFASFNPDVGYVQGMNFIAAGLLATLSEECSFWMLVLVVQVCGAARCHNW